MLASLGIAAVLAVLVAAVQIVPSIEFISQTMRSGVIDATDVYRYSVTPCRFAEFLWPNVFGTLCPENRSWLQAAPPAGEHNPWTVSLYMGGSTIILALTVRWMEGRGSGRSWMTTILLVWLFVSSGKCGGPLWWARQSQWTSWLDHTILREHIWSPTVLSTMQLEGLMDCCRFCFQDSADFDIRPKS